MWYSTSILFMSELGRGCKMCIELVSEKWFNCAKTSFVKREGRGIIIL